MSQPIPMQRRPGSFPSGGANDPTSGGLLSPKSAENLGLKLVNLILEDNSPAVKELETRVKTLKLNYVSIKKNCFIFYTWNIIIFLWTPFCKGILIDLRVFFILENIIYILFIISIIK